MNEALFYALSSTIVFSLASLSYSYFSKKFSATWMNAFKATVALVGFFIVASLRGELLELPSWWALFMLIFGGFIGLNIGDFFILRAFQSIGPARTLIVFSFQPLFMAGFAYVFFAQSLNLQQWLAVLLLILCVLNISYEKYRLDRKWEFVGPAFALLGVLLDCVGVVMTREAFETDPQLSVMAANFWRCLGAGIGFAIMAKFIQIKFKRRFFKLKTKTKMFVIGTSFLGTFLALYLYLAAIASGNLAQIAAVVGSGPLFTAIFECIWKKSFPNRYLLISLTLFGLGFFLLTQSV